ncbi:hypothetical protein OROGR_014392 [Orobanche gracilis]
MSAFIPAEKLQPARKAWKSLKNHLRSKLNRSKILNSMKTIRRRFSITKRSPPCTGHHSPPNNYTIYVGQLFTGPVSVAEPRKFQENMDGLFPRPVDKSGPRNNNGSIQTRSVELFPAGDEDISTDKEKGKDGWSSKCSSSADVKWEVLFPVPRFRCIDDRAEEFIAKFRQRMQLEREQSILEFEEMMKRSA